jgi:glycosyltransferase involved in cell wall biosynthesis
MRLPGRPVLTVPLGEVHVLHIITRMVKGGAQENTLATAAGLTSPDWRSTLVTGPAIGPEGSMEAEVRASGVRTIELPELVREPSPALDLQACAKLTALLRRERPEIVHTHTSKAGFVGRIAARAAGIPHVIHTPHGHVFHSYESRLKTAMFLLAERACRPLARRLVALTPRERDEHVELGVGRDGDWTVVHSGVDFAPFLAARGSGSEARRALGIPSEHTVIGTVGRLVPIKGQCYLVDAFARVAAGRGDLHLLLVGDGELRDELEGRARSANLGIVSHDRRVPESIPQGGSRVHFLGLRRDVPRLMAAMDLFALPSLNEGMGRVLVEAMSMGLPCVASRVSGIPDVVEEGSTGILAPPRDPAGLATGLQTLLNDPALRADMGAAGHARVVPEFSRERMLEKLEALYRDLLQQRR